MPVYVVSGFLRSGTSMMMRCLQAGGLEAVGAHDPCGYNERYGRGDYLPNPCGFFMYQGDAADPALPQLLDGKLVKLPYQQMRRTAPGEYRVVFMLRDPAEIRASLERFFAADLAEVTDSPEWQDLLRYKEAMKEAADALKARPGVEVHLLDYADVIRKPLKEFTGLATLGWPIDIVACAQAVDWSLYRSRRE